MSSINSQDEEYRKKSRWRRFWELLKPKSLPQYAKNPQIIVLISFSYAMLVLAAIYALHWLFFVCQLEPRGEYLMGNIEHLPNFFFMVFGTVATLSAAILAFCLVTLDYKEMSSLGQIAEMIEQEYAVQPKGTDNKTSTRFAIQDVGLFFGLLSDPDDWARIFLKVKMLWIKNGEEANKTCHILICPDELLKGYLSKLLSSMTDAAKLHVVEKLRDFFMNNDFQINGTNADIALVPYLAGGWTESLDQGLIELLMAYHGQIVSSAKARKVKVGETSQINAERYICYGRRACAYYVLQERKNSEKANSVQGFVTNESAFVNFFFEMIKARYKKSVEAKNNSINATDSADPYLDS